jgi:hypothetical protein
MMKRSYQMALGAALVLMAEAALPGSPTLSALKSRTQIADPVRRIGVGTEERSR